MVKTKIHGKMYDLTNFNHPGGSIPIDIIDNKDSTCLFESYHPVSNREKLNNILSKYEVHDDNSIIQQDVYDFSIFNDDFTKEVRMEVYNYFNNIATKNNCTLIEATKMTAIKKIELIVLASIFIINLIRWFYTNNFIYLFTIPFSYYLLLVNYFHDAGHFALFTNKYIETIMFCCIYFIYSSIGWYNYHTYEHHSYANIVNSDIDLDNYVNINRLYVYNYFVQILCTTLYSNNSLDIKLIRYNYKHLLFVLINILYKILYIKLFFIDKLIFGIFKSILSYFIPIICIQILFAIFTQINHIHKENFTNNQHFYRHQILTSTNVKTNSYIMRIFSGGLNCQIEHHLFPSINSCHLPEIAKIVKPLCKKYNIHYNEYDSLFSAVYDTIITAKKLNNKTINDYNFKIK